MAGARKPTPSEFRPLFGKIIFEKKKKLDPKRAWCYVTTTKAHYPHHPLEVGKARERPKKTIEKKRSIPTTPIRHFHKEGMYKRKIAEAEQDEHGSEQSSNIGLSVESDNVLLKRRQIIDVRQENPEEFVVLD